MNSKGTRVDFSLLGSASAFPGDLARSWAAMLVEPPGITQLRERAEGRLVRLGDLAPPRSGIATRVVDYFIVEEVSDPVTLATFGVRSRSDKARLAVIRDGRDQLHVIERGALRPIVRRPGQLEGRLFASESSTAPHKVFYVHEELDELRKKRWARTLEYIRYGETTNFAGPEGSRRRGGVPAERPQVRVRRVWYQVPTIETGPGRVCWIKGRGNTHYAPVLDDNVLVPDNFLVSSPPHGLEKPETFAAVANLTWTHLMVEVNGRRGGGDGVLHTYKRDLMMLPMIDPRRFSSSQSDDLLSLLEPLKARAVQHVDEELRQRDRQAFDLWAMEYLFGKDEAQSAARAVERALRNLASERAERSASGREQEQKAVRRREFDPSRSAARVLVDVGPPPSILAEVARYEDATLDSITVSVAEHATAMSVALGNTLFEADMVFVNGEAVAEAPSYAHGQLVELLLKSHANYYGDLPLPRDEHQVLDIVSEAIARRETWERSVGAALEQHFPGPQRSMRREEVRAAVAQQAEVVL